MLVAADARDAKRVYEQHRAQINLVITDLVLPDSSGRQLAQDIRAASPEIPILLTSGYGEAECSPESLDHGTHYLPKPYSKVNLVQKIVEITGRPLQRVAKQTG